MPKRRPSSKGEPSPPGAGQRHPLDPFTPEAIAAFTEKARRDREAWARIEQQETPGMAGEKNGGKPRR